MFLLFVLQFFIVGISNAGNWDWMSDTPLAHFTEKDMEVLRTTAREALDNSSDGTRVAWENPETGISGSVTLIKTTDRDGYTCRKVKFINNAKNLTNTLVHRLCKQADGTWKIDR